MVVYCYTGDFGILLNRRLHASSGKTLSRHCQDQKDAGGAIIIDEE